MTDNFTIKNHPVYGDKPFDELTEEEKKTYFSFIVHGTDNVYLGAGESTNNLGEKNAD